MLKRLRNLWELSKYSVKESKLVDQSGLPTPTTVLTDSPMGTVIKLGNTNPLEENI